MKLKTAQLLVEAAGEDGTVCTLYEGYSGRGMYGKTTTGVVVENVTDLAVLAAVATSLMDDDSEGDDQFDDFLMDLKDLRTDNMGHDTIVY